MLIEGTSEIKMETNGASPTVSNTTVTHRVRNKSAAAGDLASLGFQTNEGATDTLRAKISAGLGTSLSAGYISLSTRASGGAVAEALKLDENQHAYFRARVRLGVDGTPSDLLHVVKESACSLYFDEYSTDASCVTPTFRKARGTLASPSNVAQDDEMAEFSFQAYAGSFFGTASIRAYVDDTVTSSQRPASRIEFYTNQKNASPVKAITLNKTQDLNVAANVATTAGGNTTGRLLFGSAQALGIYWGSGAPSISAGKGSLYLRTDGSSTSTRAYINTDGATTWTAITTAA